MDTAEAVIAGKLEALRQELGERIRTEQAYQEELAQHAYQREAAKRAQREEFERLLREGKYPAVDMSLSGTGPLASVSGGHFKRLLDIDRLEAQVKLLQELQQTLDEERSATREGVGALTARYERLSRRNVWLTIATFVLLLLLGWLLSLVGSPATVLHMFGRQAHPTQPLIVQGPFAYTRGDERAERGQRQGEAVWALLTRRGDAAKRTRAKDNGKRLASRRYTCLAQPGDS